MKSFIPLVLFVALAACTEMPSTKSSDAAPSTDLVVFENVRVLSMTESGVIEDARVVVEGAQIKSVAAMSDGASPSGAQIVDGAGKTLMPGLADMHVHYWPETGPLFIANSVTTVRNLWGSVNSAGWDEDAKTGAIVGPHHYFSGPLIDGPDPIWGDGSVRISSAEQLVGAIESQRSAGFRAVKLYEGLTPDIYRAGVAAAKERDMQIWTHIPGGLTYEEVVDLGVDSIEHLNNIQDILLPDGTPPMPGRKLYYEAWTLAVPEKMTRIAEKVAAAGVWNAPTYMVTLKSDEYGADVKAYEQRPEYKYVDPQTASWWQGSVKDIGPFDDTKREAGTRQLAMIKALYDAGAPLLIATDAANPYVLHGFSIHGELAAFVEAGIPVGDVLRIATADAAKFLGEEEKWGVVKTGARADLVLLDANPLDTLETLRDPAGVMMNGQWRDRRAIKKVLTKLEDEVAEMWRQAEAEEAAQEETAADEEAVEEEASDN